MQPLNIQLTEKEIKTNRFDEITAQELTTNGTVTEIITATPQTLVKSRLKYSKGLRSPMDTKN